ncbi:bifunctional molybdenum cofactor biosynthesis protein MoaC/MoaB [Gramella jeungdoensis]|uniref:Molybdopterin adenylyltransferase n=1 Tax=Gramella jeungdoensis TaxID=708091 RepID=A0ABT0Z121_9FLAO|nr:bifunctional molybdenum cofactor biosynthesis protein MoaC/MoaB [Gramella jeungdoensis]MCM8569095.1 bifunctional molybdenum cofactor biosynthesis protein MoaC/MoaB [Gramella jeungdoensis]
MVDITHKIKTLRIAVAEAFVKVGDPATISAIKNNVVPKGNVLEMAKTAGLFAVKNTHHTIPDCHPLPVEFTLVNYEIEEGFVRIIFTVKTVYKTGVEVEAMHGASVVALTMYDMLKPIDKNIEIEKIRLVEKKGGKSDFNKHSSRLSASVIVCSDSISEGKKEDRAGKAIIKKLKESKVTVNTYQIIPDELEIIRSKALEYSETDNLVIFTGGTGLSFRDVTPEALEPILERRIPGIEEAIRNYGQERMPYAMLSRSIAGTIGNCLIMGLPGSTKGASESMDAVFPHLLHVFKILRGAKHDNND